MNTFELIKYDDSGQECIFYTVQQEGSTDNETDKFFTKFRSQEKFKRYVQELAIFLTKRIAMEDGALPGYFRYEERAQALPPTGIYEVGEIEIDYTNFPLRLYCLRLSNQLVILFNGGEKTSLGAMHGKTSMTFIEANQFAKRIEEALTDGTICFTKNGRGLKMFSGSTEIIL